jgi:hypothetical protein
MQRFLRFLVFFLVVFGACSRAKVATIVPPSPAEIVEKQVVAYNAKDVEVFVSFYAEDAIIYEAGEGSKESIKGKAQMREVYGKLFASNPALFCEIKSRRTEGNFVFDEEHLSGLANGYSFVGVVKYEVTGGLIQKVWIESAVWSPPAAP